MTSSSPIQLLALFIVFIATAVFSQSESSTVKSLAKAEEKYEKTSDDATLNLHRWGAVTLFHGLPSERVNAITEDANGALWFGTDNGLVRYDGRRTQSIGNEGDSRGVLPAQRIRALFKDSSGGLWIGTDQGAVRLLGEKLEPLKDTNGQAVTSFAESPNNEIALVTEQGQIIRYQSRNADIKRAGEKYAGNLAARIIDSKMQYLLNIDNSAVALQAITYSPQNNDWWIGSHRRGALINTAEKITEAVPPPTRPYFVNAVLAEGENIWLGAQTSEAESGLWLLRAEGFGRFPLITGEVHSLQSGGGDVWIGTDRQGAFLLRGGHQIEHLTFENTKGGLRSNRIYSVYRDHEGVVWFGTDRGVCRYDRDSFRATTLSNDGQSNFVRALLTTKDGVTYAGTNRGLFRLEAGLELGGWQQMGEVGNRAIYSLLESKDGRILVGTAGGLFTRQKTEPLFSELPFENKTTSHSIRALIEFKDKVYALVFEVGLAEIDSGSVKLIADAAVQKATCFAVSEAKQIMSIATTDDYFRYDGTKISTLTGKTERRAEHGLIHALAMTSDHFGDHLWIGTERGLFTIIANQWSSVVSGLDVQALFVMVEGPDNHPVIYCATKNAGLYKIRPDNGAIVRFDTEQGLPSPQVFSVTKGSNGEIWIGTNRGIVRHQPNPNPPVLEPRRLVADRVYSADYLITELRFPAYQQTYLLEVAGLGSKTFPSQFQYEYTLTEEKRGLVKKVISPEPQFELKDMKAGNYTIIARAISRDLVYSAPYQLKIWISPEQISGTTILLTGLLGLALVAGSYAFYQQQRTAKANQKLEITNDELLKTRISLANTTETERSRIARDLHDQTLGDLRHLLVMTDQLDSPVPNTQPPTPAAIRKKIEEVSNEIRHICEDLSPSVLENIGFIPALEWALTDAVTHLPGAEKFAFEFVCEPDLEERLQLSPTEQIQLYRIVQEAINNVCRHAQATRVSLDVSVENDSDLMISVNDDGIGIKSNPDNPTGHGMSNIRSRANLIGAETIWLDTETGCHFEVRKAQVVAAVAIDTPAP